MGGEVTILFFRCPERGRVKTRLARSLGEDAALELYRALLADLFDAAQGAGRPIVAAYSGAGGGCPPGEGCEYTAIIQRGDDLGARMYHALADTAAMGCDRLVLAGSDCPGLDTGRFAAAFSALDEADAVLGPSRDGGYYLVGLHAAVLAPELFEGIEWSTARVFAQSLAIMRGRGLAVAVIDEDDDIDDIDDLRCLAAGTRGGLRTRAVIAGLVRDAAV